MSIEDLPFVDEHVVLVDAQPERAWAAVGEVVSRSFSERRAGLAARALGCRETEARGSPLEPGSTIPGFHVARAEPAHELVLAGRHRFSRYALTFRLEPSLQRGRTRVTAETRASFPGLHGRAYRMAVIGTRGHALLMRRLLDTVSRRAAGRAGGTVDRPAPG